jgi:type VI secretion system VasD/TssJ family lipoprotein
VLALLLLLSTLSGCALREQVRRVCVDVEASENLNFYEGKAHSLTVLVYALSDQTGFQAVPISELLAGHVPSGVLEPPVPFTIEPGTTMSLEHVFPAATRSIGLVADYHRLPDRVEEVAQTSERRIVLPSRCGFLAPRLRLSETRIEGA